MIEGCGCGCFYCHQCGPIRYCHTQDEQCEYCQYYTCESCNTPFRAAHREERICAPCQRRAQRFDTLVTKVKLAYHTDNPNNAVQDLAAYAAGYTGGQLLIELAREQALGYIALTPERQLEVILQIISDTHTGRSLAELTCTV